jgi:hypothetical protein
VRVPARNQAQERHPIWIVALAVVVCLAGVGGMAFCLKNGRYGVALGFLALAIVGVLLPRARNLVLRVSLRDGSATAEINAPSGRVVSDPGASQPPVRQDDDPH